MGVSPAPELSRPAHAPWVDGVRCFHCGEPVPGGVDLHLEIDGVLRPMCCAGCHAVASLIHASGLDRYYEYRDALPSRPVSGAPDLAYRAWDRDAVREQYTRPVGDGRFRVSLVLENVHCAACGWLIRRYLAREAGVGDLRLDLADGRLELTFDPRRARLSEIASALARLGYLPHLDRPGADRERNRAERRRMLRYLIVASLGMMQVMSYALAGYLAGDEMDPDTARFLRVVSMLVAVPVVLYAGQPFYRAALLQLARGRLGLDVPVATAILLALLASVWITLFGTGEVYFDSVVMFVFFLLLGRFAVMNVRHRAAAVHTALERTLPVRTRRLGPDGVEEVAVIELRPGDRVLVSDGEVVPADGRVVDGQALVDDAVLTGEAVPRPHAPGNRVLAGATVRSGTLQIEVEAAGSDTALSMIGARLSDARVRRPRLVRQADRAAAVFVAAVLVATVSAAVLWWWLEPSQVMPVVLAMLVAACPCALALGTPTALAAVTRGLAARGVLVANPDALEALGRVTHVVFDKTGTLTESSLRVSGVRALHGLDRDRALAIAAALERASSHPIARAFRGFDQGLPVTGVRLMAGWGVSGRIDGVDYRLGRPGPDADPATGADSSVELTGSDGSQARIVLEAPIRPGAEALVEALHRNGVQTLLASGDHETAVRAVAGQLGMKRWRGALTPEDKLAWVRELQHRGGVVAMIGDGINDAPVLAGADVAIAVADGTEIARSQGDVIAPAASMAALIVLIDAARCLRRVVRQNLGWALTYNLLALPVAALGLLPPWGAAIGMSASSLAVVLNAQRLSRLALKPGFASMPAPTASNAGTTG
ncbi:MAG: heavy metal translocating P-type ATPase [Wenzhouxiangellaceae bacterium]